MSRSIDPINFVGTLSANVNNENLTDEQFRLMVRKTLPIVVQPIQDKKQYWDRTELEGVVLRSVEVYANDNIKDFIKIKVKDWLKNDING